MRIAIFDYKIVSVNPSGSCHLAMLRELCMDHEFTVFSVEFENPCPERIRWVKVPAVKRPLVLLYLTFHALAPLLFLIYRWRTEGRFDCSQMVESNLVFGQVSYAHFCHRFYLRSRWDRSAATGVRGLMRWLDHKAHALLEPFVFRRARRVAVPSRGLARELSQEYPFAAEKVQVIANPVDVIRFRRPEDFDREAMRAGIGARPAERVLVFLALGHFERKGLPQLLDALSRQRDVAEGCPLRLLVVGGEASLIAAYQRKCREAAIASQVTFTGMQADVRPFLWAGDAFVLPSAYETFSLVAFQAAAAGLPLLATHLHGVEEILRHGENGFVLDGSVEGIARTLQEVRLMSEGALVSMGRRAQADVQRFDTTYFAATWRAFYESLKLDLTQGLGNEAAEARLEANIQ